MRPTVLLSVQRSLLFVNAACDSGGAPAAVPAIRCRAVRDTVLQGRRCRVLYRQHSPHVYRWLKARASARVCGMCLCVSCVCVCAHACVCVVARARAQGSLARPYSRRCLTRPLLSEWHTLAASRCNTHPAGMQQSRSRRRAAAPCVSPSSAHAQERWGHAPGGIRTPCGILCRA